MSVCPSVSLFVCPSVRRRYSVKTAKLVLKHFQPSVSHTSLVFAVPNVTLCMPIFRQPTPPMGQGVWKKVAGHIKIGRRNAITML